MGSKLLDYFNNDELAASVWQGKYAQEGEETPDDMHKRLAKEFAKVEYKYQEENEESLDYDAMQQLSKYGSERNDLSESSIFNLFKDFKYVIPQGSIMSQLGAKSIGSLSNCFVVGQPYDSYGGIFFKDQELAQLMKRRGGVGIDISTLRPVGVATSNAAKSSTGAISFMHRFSNTTREVAQNGRRGALMISIDINHPDVEEFAVIKRDLSQVTGANISIKLNKEFMEAVENDEDYILRFPCTKDLSVFTKDYLDVPYNELCYIEDHTDNNSIIHIKKVKAKQLWDETIKSAHNVAEPGLMFWDNMVDYSPDGVYPQFKQVTTNPCSEIGMQPYDACRLIAVNLFSFVENPFTDIARFDIDKFYQINYEAMRLSDDLIDLEMEHIERILEKIDSDPEPNEVKLAEKELWKKVYTTAKASRRTGLGFTGLGDALAALNVKYDSDQGLNVIENIMKVKMQSELDCTTDMAITRGTFEGWSSALELPSKTQGRNSFYQFICEEFPEQAEKMYYNGRRNVSWSTVAPTGSLSIMAKAITNSNISSGLEPVFASYYMRRKKVNPQDVGARVDFTDQNGDTWQEYPIVMGAFKDWLILQGHSIEDINEMSKGQMEHYFNNSPWFGSTANDIDWIRRVEIQGVIQKYISHSISSTINLPSDVSEEEVAEIYLESWKKGLKGITVYRDGSRSGVLVSSDAKDENSFEYRDAPKRPKSLEGHGHTTIVKGVPHNVIVGLLDDKPYEIFIDTETNFKGIGHIIKKSKNTYYFKQNDVTVDISSNMTDEQAAITRLVSTSLRHGANIKFIVEQLNKSDGDLFSFTKGLARVLKKYIPDGTESTVNCNECGSENVIFQEGCNSCQDCGNSKCG